MEFSFFFVFVCLRDVIIIIIINHIIIWHSYFLLNVLLQLQSSYSPHIQPFMFLLLFAGGLILKGNPWTCDCGLVWLGHWLRRYLRETKQIHTVVLEGALQLHSLAREATCTDPRTGQQTPIPDLYPEDLRCHASALSRGGSSSTCAFSSRHQRTLVALLLIYWWS
jgi:hypothetical protein